MKPTGRFQIFKGNIVFSLISGMLKGSATGSSHNGPLRISDGGEATGTALGRDDILKGPASHQFPLIGVIIGYFTSAHAMMSAYWIHERMLVPFSRNVLAVSDPDQVALDVAALDVSLTCSALEYLPERELLRGLFYLRTACRLIYADRASWSAGDDFHLLCCVLLTELHEVWRRLSELDLVRYILLSPRSM
ncbi:hypothetical protein CRG98_009252 [Punica granatum]|uniref:Uncharacterized protein n=1 Tax=Punica granatum TaxID=22663 RepID=A0A2I0KPG5_PUNGR|nr:hypothetical protein CRG98_009252 [Punica granatum]